MIAAKKWYWDETVLRHVTEVLRTGSAMVRRIHGRELTAVEEVALIAHDIDKCLPNKEHTPKEQHGVEGARLLPEFLAMAGIALGDDEVAAVQTAIVEHETAKGSPSSELSDLVQSADASSPDIPAQVRKCWSKNKDRFPDEQERADYVVRYLRGRYGHGGSAKHPRYFEAFYDVEAYRSGIDALTSETVADIARSNSPAL